MFQTFVTVAIFIAFLAALPYGVRWIQRRSMGGTLSVSAASKVVSAVAVGPHQRVVTVEVGPEGSKTWLVLGVTAQAITCLHKWGDESAAKLSLPAAETDAPHLMQEV